MLLATSALFVLIAAPSVTPPAADPGRTASPVSFAAPLPLLLDGGNLTLVSGAAISLVGDSVRPLASTMGTRSYSVDVRVSLGLPLVRFNLRTDPNSIWSWPGAIPEGPSALPPLSDWSWSVWSASSNVTSSWSVVDGGRELQCAEPAANATFTIVGTSTPVVPISIQPGARAPFAPASVGFAINSAVNNGSPILPANDPGYARLAKALRPTVVRVDLVDMKGAASWNAVTQSPKFNFTTFDSAFAFASTVGARVLLTISAGSWGDGNLLPTGMPLNGSIVVSKGGLTGYFPTSAAYRSYVRAVAQHVVSANETVAYWGIGNEVPLTNASEVGAFVQTFNTASVAVRSVIPAALVGTDVMMNKTYLPTFARSAVGVGFLSFHFYPSIGECVVNGTFCPPAGPGNGTFDGRLWMPFAGIFGQGFYDPVQAQDAWHNVTNTWVPVIDTESNLNGAGGGVLTAAEGTDPRQQNLFGASWVVATLIDGSNSNLSELTYFTYNGNTATPQTISGPYGGWGYGMTAQAPNGTNVVYAPYWALRMWANAVPAGATPVPSIVGSPGLLKVYAVDSSNHVGLVVVNQVNVPVTVEVSVNGTGWIGNWSKTLDDRSYVQVYNASLHRVVLERSGISAASLGGKTGPWSLTISGYGVLTLGLVHPGSHRGPRSSGSPGTSPAAGISTPASSAPSTLSATTPAVPPRPRSRADP